MKRGHTTATIDVATIARMVAYMVAPTALVPALMVNVDWSGASGWGWSASAVGSILFSALFFEASRHAGTLVLRLVYPLAGTILIAVNIMVAFDNASHGSDHRSDHRRSAMVAAKTQSSQRSQWSQGRTEAATVAGETAVEAVEGEIQAAIARDSGRWQSTGECNPTLITAGPSKSFCAAVATLKSKLAAAKRRDELDGKIAQLDAKTVSQEVPTVADTYAEGIASLVAIFGHKMSDDAKHAITASKDALRSIALEVTAALGPTAWLLLVDGLFAAFAKPTAPAHPRGEKLSQKTGEQKSTRAEPAPTTLERAADLGPDTTPPVPLDDPFHRFVAARLDDVNGALMKADEPWQLWLAWCREQKLEPGSQKAFGAKMKARFAWEPNNNRPRYLNVRAKQVGPIVRLVPRAS